MTFFEIIVLSLVQSLTEFLPISSSAHLIITPILFGWKQNSLVFDLVLHAGTAFALVVFFAKDLIYIYKSFVSDFFKFNVSTAKYSKNGFLGLIIILANVPAVILGLFFNDFIESYFRNLTAVTIFMVIGTFLMILAEKIFSKNKEKLTNVEDLSLKKGFLIGVFQSLAIFPGMSRSGSTLSAGMILGLDREAATKFSFLLSLPIVFMAFIYEFITSTDLLLETPVSILLQGLVASFLFGLVVIRFFLQFVKSNSLYPFIIYRVGLIIFLLFTILK